MATLADRLDHLLGRKTAEALAESFGMTTVEDLLRHYPHRYATQGAELGDSQPAEGQHVTIIARVAKADEVRMKSRPGTRLAVVLESDRQKIDVTFFNPHKVKYNIKPGVRGMFSGTVKYFRDKWSLAHPSYIILPEPRGPEIGGAAPRPARVRGAGALAGMARSAQGDGGIDMSIFDRALIPMYPATRDVESWTVMRCVRQILDQLETIDDPLPDWVRREHGLIGLDEALRRIHLPDDRDDVTAARERLRFDEAAAVQLVLARRRHDVAVRTAPACPRRSGGIADEFDRRLPFELTAGQLAVAGEIAADLAGEHPMNRLLQGEVGSGKTIVALRAMLQVIDAGHQCALLAPTEVLAAQHARSLTRMLGDLAEAGELGAHELATKVTLVTGSMGTARKRQALLDIVSGDSGLVIGTHALIQQGVEFHDLGLVVVDEQHRFGVEQRDVLRNRGRDGASPHVLVMTATPIPRTIAMTVLGDLEVSTLRELPRGRSPITSRVVAAKVHPSWVTRAWERIGEEVAAGRQAYVVCSRIGDGDSDEDADLVDVDVDEAETTGGRRGKGTPPETKSVLQQFEELAGGPLAHLRVGLLHGRLPADEKDAVMRDFAAGDIDVLVCTTVVEVGVDVPNATVMVIVDADRFGVSQLHQLRGRVGRGGHAGLCLLVTDSKPGAPAMARLEAVAATTDGFALAQLDLQQRREGDVLGVAQSGTTSTLRMLSLVDDVEVISAAQAFARAVTDRDPRLEDHPGLARMVSAALDTERVAYLEKS
ncbi:ATP-dependent DNA helicase RecG [Rhodococcus ruber]|uniref:ATP-dependent DNA helicase RecG n=1 Tax=Rhodococcus ruber TaxID=1830 RepID=A0A098BIU8_9NOCA|nr:MULTISPECIES: ATP-dependent DNA helicase RecG [Rhodococcus]AWG98801.1 ATP-dependent DNA helicase RecG [Rhodococcus ruber]MCD2126387.1 ATP-dependent DNA helicase RecG [Rhodococcus ruber]MCZ1074072.1 ATP-dependent DNA helicase RecG [Rhodococcus sp. A5(2022)]MCZ4502716.1 ATP-dependent DNA helicase RecG [Rhodococcus ruber]MCZ4529695.1 ATP-dependent DNA helicase RecG [Rhodococcus ruber]